MWVLWSAMFVWGLSADTDWLRSVPIASRRLAAAIPSIIGFVWFWFWMPSDPLINFETCVGGVFTAPMAWSAGFLIRDK